jgi:hypothetical protein
MKRSSDAKAMIEDILEAILISAVGDTVLWQNEKYTVAGRAVSGCLWRGYAGNNAGALSDAGPVLLCLSASDEKYFIPEREARIVATNPRYVMERILTYLDKKGAIDWDQLDLETEGDDTARSGE